MELVSAWYGHPSIAQQRVNVTEKLRSDLAAGKRSLVVDNGWAGADPSYGTRKRLEVTWRDGGNLTRTSALEQDTFALRPAASLSAAKPALGAKTEVLSAWYGHPTNPRARLDVTGRLASEVAAGRNRIAATNDRMGADPAVGVRKQLEVTWRRGGQPVEVSRIGEGGFFSADGPTLSELREALETAAPQPIDLQLGAQVAREGVAARGKLGAFAEKMASARL
jgi:hypothetical protein